MKHYLSNVRRMKGMGFFLVKDYNPYAELSIYRRGSEYAYLYQTMLTKGVPPRELLNKLGVENI